ncbi:MAG: hypothetical protein ACMUIP_03745 [bacterium]
MYKKSYIISICFTGLLLFSTGVSVTHAQIPLNNPFALAFGAYTYGRLYPPGNAFSPPTIRLPVFGQGWPGATLNSRGLSPAMPAPRPVVRHAAATITLLITQGPTSALIVYNPTILFGVSAPTIVPTALTLPALLGGQPLIFGSTPITSNNLLIFNYVANSSGILPSGIAIYILP